MGKSSLSSLVWVGALLALPLPAVAAPRLDLRVSTCPGGELSTSEVERSLRAELEADALVELTEQSAELSLSADVGCDASLSTSLRLRSAASSHESERTIVLADAKPSARAGVIALAAAELVRSELSAVKAASTSEQPSRADYPSEAVVPPPRVPPRSSPPSPAAETRPMTGPDRPRPLAPRAFRIAVDARLRWFIDAASVSYGGAAGFDSHAWRVRAEALFSAPRDALGTASLGSAAAQVGYRVFDQPLGALRISGYPALAAGVTWMRGTTSSSSVKVTPATGFYADARWVTEARLELATLAVELGRSTGYVARSEGRTLGATGGFFVGANAGGSF